MNVRLYIRYVLQTHLPSLNICEYHLYYNSRKRFFGSEIELKPTKVPHCATCSLFVGTTPQGAQQRRR